MSHDLIERLRKRQEFYTMDDLRWYKSVGLDSDCQEAASALETAERDRMEALGSVAGLQHSLKHFTDSAEKHRARASEAESRATRAEAEALAWRQRFEHG